MATFMLLALAKYKLGNGNRRQSNGVGKGQSSDKERYLTPGIRTDGTAVNIYYRYPSPTP